MGYWVSDGSRAYVCGSNEALVFICVVVGGFESRPVAPGSQSSDPSVMAASTPPGEDYAVFALDVSEAVGTASEPI
jgi:hypothetical protein